MQRYRPEDFSHISHEGLVTILGFGSLVSEASARQSFDLTNFRIGTVNGVQRIFNRADWINIDWGVARVPTGEVCSLAMAHTGDADVKCRIALMDVTAIDGVAGFLHRESGYRIIEVSYEDDNGVSGTALACGECSDEEARKLWGEDMWYLQHCKGKISYVGDSVLNSPMPLVPPEGCTPGDPTKWLDFTSALRSRTRRYELPPGPWVYPCPGYLRMVYRAHVRAGIDDNFLDTTLLMDRQTTLREYLNANPLLLEWVTDPKLYSDRVFDSHE